VLSNRFGVIRGCRRVKRVEEAELQFAMASCNLHAIAHEGRRRARAILAQAPPGQLAAWGGARRPSAASGPFH
jgi:hypothetical protein